MSDYEYDYCYCSRNYSNEKEKEESFYNIFNQDDSSKFFGSEEDVEYWKNQRHHSYDINKDNDSIENYDNVPEGLPFLHESTQITEDISKIITPKTEICKPKIIFGFIKEKKQEKKVLGQKRNRNKNCNGKVHKKSDFDNVARKIKTKLFGGILKILNNSLYEKKIFHISKAKTGRIAPMQFVKIHQDYISQTSVQSTLNLLNATLRDIFSQKCSKKYKNYRDNNLNLIKEISGKKIYEKTNKILDMTFFECLEHFRGTKTYEVLIQLEKEYERVLGEFRESNEDKTYIETFSESLLNFEKNFRKIKPKKSKFSEE